MARKQPAREGGQGQRDHAVGEPPVCGDGGRDGGRSALHQDAKPSDTGRAAVLFVTAAV